ncbi:MAG: hypothetical protein ABIT83_04285 [Massilia sp.]
MNKPAMIFACLLMLGQAGCAVQHTHVDAPMTVVSETPGRWTLTQTLPLTLQTGYSRILKQGSRWTVVGQLSQGTVYRPYHDVFTLEGANTHEAYLVVANDVLVGFYLPAEAGFSPFGPRPSISLKQ